MKLKVLQTNRVWQSDDGSRAKYQVMTDNGEMFSTWSRIIGQAEKGQEFEVVVEEREDYKGYKEKYVKQATAAFKDRFSSTDRESIERQVALKCAVEFATSREQMKAIDVVKLAQKFDEFLKEGRSG